MSSCLRLLCTWPCGIRYGYLGPSCSMRTDELYRIIEAIDLAIEINISNKGKGYENPTVTLQAKVGQF